MLLDNHLLTIPICSGLIFVIVGWVMLKFPPKEINSLYGYRTKNSMKSKERWDFAQDYSSKEMTKLGFILFLSGWIGLVCQPSENIAAIIGISLMIFMIILLIFRVERAINRRFNTD